MNSTNLVEWLVEHQNGAFPPDTVDESKKAIIDYWGHDVDHDWPWWFRQMYYFLENLDLDP